MTTEQVQAALIRLVRFPDRYREDGIDELIAGLTLTPGEVWRVRALAGSPHLAKFGRAQRDARFTKSVVALLPLTAKLVGEKALRHWFADVFEPAHPQLAVEDISDAVADALAAMPAELGASSRIACLPDLVRYELADFNTFAGLRELQWNPPAGSLVRRDARLDVCALSYDIPALVAAVEGGATVDEAAASVERRDCCVLFARVPDPTEPDQILCHRIEIDEDLRDFLRAEMRDPPPRPVRLPPAFDDLVSLGILEERHGVTAMEPS